MPREMDEQELLQEMPLPKTAESQGRKPAVKARVVYLGAMRNKSVSLSGRVLVTKYEVEPGQKSEVREISEGGMSCYDFSTHDTIGNVIESRLLPREYPVERLRGKPVVPVEHIDHLRYFYLERGPGGEPEYEVLANQTDHAMLLRHVERLTAAEKSKAELLEKILQ